MHVVGRSIISSAVDAKVSHSLNVTSVGERALVISDNSNFDTIFESSDHSVCEIVIGHSEDADQECLLCAGDVLANFFYVRLVWEEKGIHILGLSSHKVVLDMLDKFLKVFKYLLALIIMYLFCSSFKQHLNCLVHSSDLVSLRHLSQRYGEILHIQIVKTKIFA